MKNLQIFNNIEFGQIRCVDIDGKPYAVGNDIAGILEYARPYEAVSAHCKGAVTYRVPTEGGMQDVKVVPEGDIYRLIVKAADQSKNPEIREKAEKIERWIFDEVIPAIRKTGTYNVQPASAWDLIIAQAQSSKEMEARLQLVEQKTSFIEEKTIAAHQRIDSMDAVNAIGDLQQRLNAMIRKYAQQEGLSFSKAWQDFIQSYNNAYRTNLNLLKSHYKMRNNVKDLTTPKYLSLTDKLMDAVRVADKLINKTSREVMA